MNTLLRLRLIVAVFFVLLLGGCASTDTIRGTLHYDLRPEGARADVVWPAAPETPRYRYLGELVGEPNFVQSDNTKSNLTTAFKWLVGLFEVDKQIFLQRPQHGTVGDSGRVYVVDTGRNAVVVFDPNPPAGDDSKNKEGHLLVWDLATSNARFEVPVAVAMAWNGELAVSDSKLGVVARLNVNGEPVGLLINESLKRPTGLAFAPERGLLFVADSVAHDIKVFDGKGTLVNTFGAPGEGDGELNAPTHLAYSNGLLYVSDTLNSRIQIFDADGRYISGFGERGLYVGNLMRPKGVAVGDSDIVYVVESYYGRLLAFSKQKDLLLDISGSGLKDGAFRLPAGVWADKQGRIFVADMFNGRVIVYKFISPSGG